jgi:hypothetical protein
VKIRSKLTQIEKKLSKDPKMLAPEDRIFLIYIGDGKSQEAVKKIIEKNERRLEAKYGTTKGVVYVKHWVPEPLPLHPRFKR